MKVTGRPDLKEYGDEANVRQPPGPSEHWQDSVVLTWWDTGNEIGGFHRLGHQPNYRDGPMVSLWNNLMSPIGMYKNTIFKPLRDSDLLPNGGFGCGDETCIYEYIDGEHIWKIADGDVSAELRFRDIGGNVDCFPKKGSLTEDFATAHFDIPGRVTGWLKMQGKEWKINGLGIRDHGWGTRDWDTILSHRWVVGTCGRDLSFVVLAWHSSDDALVSFGWVIRGDEITFAKRIDLLAYMEIDAATNRGGHVKLTLSTDEILEIECVHLAKRKLQFLSITEFVALTVCASSHAVISTGYVTLKPPQICSEVTELQRPLVPVSLKMGFIQRSLPRRETQMIRQTMKQLQGVSKMSSDLRFYNTANLH